MKNALMALVAVSAFVMGTAALAADPTVKHVDFNVKKGAYTVELEGQSPMEFDAGGLVIKLDTTAQTPYLKKGLHFYYVVFPSFTAMNRMVADSN